MSRTRVKIDSLVTYERDVLAFFPEVFSKRNRKQAFAEFARAEIAKADAQNKSVLGRVPPKTVSVDGKPGASIDSATKVVVAEYHLVEDVLRYIDEWLVLFSPVGRAGDKRPGHPELYARSHLLFGDHESLDIDGAIPVRNEYFFTNLQPYARRIERGWSSQARAGVYHVVAEMAKQRFSDVADIKFSFRSPESGAIAEWAAKTSMVVKSRKGAKRDEWLRRQPAIVIRIK